MPTVELTTSQLTTADLVASLRCDVCPICKGFKRARQTMCPADYRRLPAQLKRDLYLSIWDGYGEAVRQAMRALGVTIFHAPPRPPVKGN